VREKGRGGTDSKGTLTGGLSKGGWGGEGFKRRYLQKTNRRGIAALLPVKGRVNLSESSGKDKKNKGKKDIYFNIIEKESPSL